MGKRSGPRHGSLAFYPRRRAKRIFPSVSVFKPTSEGKLLGFACYKAGMTHVIAVDNYEASPSYGQHILIPCTILECPPLFVFGIRAYKKSYEGLKAFTEAYAEKLDKNIERRLVLSKKHKNAEALKLIEDNISEVAELRALAQMQPSKIKLKKTPELIEFSIGGKTAADKLAYAKQTLGKEIRIQDLFKDGDTIDVIAITKGKGIAGPVKRFGITIQVRKSTHHRRHAGAIGAWTPSRVLWQVPMAGQLGFQRRTEYNKRILKMGTSGEEATPAGGIPHYGKIIGDYALVQGSLPGPKKRLIVIRQGIRKQKETPIPTITEVSRVTQQ